MSPLARRGPRRRTDGGAGTAGAAGAGRPVSAPGRVVAGAGAGVLVVALSGCGGSPDDPTLGAGASGSPSATSSSPASAAPVTCPVTPEQVPPPAGAVTDLGTKPTVAASSAAPPQTVQVADLVTGTGPAAQPGSRVQVKYVGAFYESGSEFDSSWSRGADSTLPFIACGEQVIPGFSVAPVGMKVGGRRQVVIPSRYGYGEQGTGPIPGGATLVFVIDLVATSGP